MKDLKVRPLHIKINGKVLAKNAKQKGVSCVLKGGSCVDCCQYYKINNLNLGNIPSGISGKIPQTAAAASAFINYRDFTSKMDQYR